MKKLLKNARKYVSRHIYTESSDTLASVHKHQLKCDVVPYATLEETSSFKDSLEVTESLQY